MKFPASLKRCSLTFAMLILFSISLQAQQIVNRPVSLSVKNISLGDALDSISRQGGFYFSFKTIILPLQQKVSLNGNQKTVGEALQHLLGDQYIYTEQGQYLLLHAAPFYTLSGYITDSLNAVPLDQVTLTAGDQQKIAVTDAAGFFSLRLNKNDKVVSVTVRKMGYVPARFDAHAGMSPVLLRLEPALVALAPVEIASRPGDGFVKGQWADMFRLHTPGVKFAGLLHVNDDGSGPVQFAFAVNVANRSYNGLQLTSLHNVVKDTLSGVQVAGLINKVEGDMAGVQLSAFNYAKRNKGLQIGAVNIADSSEGWSLGMLNVVKGDAGYRRISLYTNDMMNTNVSLKTGNATLYNIWMLGIHLGPTQKMTAIGVGLGHDFILSPKFKLAAQACYHVISAGLGYENRLMQFRLLPEYRLNRHFTLYGGLTANRYKNRDASARPGYRDIADIGNNFDFSNRGKIKSWIGWELGITYDPRYNYTEGLVRQPGAWGFGIGLGLGLSSRNGFSKEVTSVALRAEKYIFEDIAFTLTAGYSYVNFYNQRMLPLTAGLKVFQGRLLYVAAECGAAVRDFRKVAFLFAPSVGLNYKDKIDLSFRSDFYSAQEVYLGLRLTYNLGFLRF